MAFVLLFALTVTMHLHLLSAACPSHCKAGLTCNAEDSGCPECKQAYYGRTCQHRLECLISANGIEYRGQRNQTVSRITCQRWDTNTPHRHGTKSRELEENYCRNPDGDPGPWCYTTDPRKRWELCGVPSCSNQCLAPPLNSSGVDINNPPPDGFVVGFNAIIECMTGYESSGQPAIATLQCENDTTWTQSPLPVCNKVQCPSLTNAHIRITNPKSKYEYQDSITVVCEPGYTLRGQNTLTCQVDKSWGPLLPTCSINECSAPGSVPNGVMLGTKAKYVFQDTITVICNNGYILNGTDNMTCQADKTWSSTPACEIVKCQRPVVNNGSISSPSKTIYQYQENIAIVCDEGYNLQGQKELTCQADTNWGHLPNCTINVCQSPALKPNSFVKASEADYQYMTTITIECEVGYTLQGESELACMADTKWNHVVPTCKINECKPPSISPRSKMLISKPLFHYQDVVTFVCDTGYRIEGASQLTCQANKTWDEAPPTCKPIECPQPSLPPSIYIYNLNGTFVYGDVIALACIEGYEFQGRNTSVCQATAQWSEPFPICEKKQCVSLELSSNLHISNENKHKYKDKVSFTCNEGYKLSHSNDLECQANKMWDNVIPFCIEVCDGFSTTQVIGVAFGAGLGAVLVAVIVTVLCMRRLLVQKKNNDTVPQSAITKQNEAFDYDTIQAQEKDENNVYNLPE